MKIITTTGTKGKTTITRAISHILNDNGMNTLRVDTDGHYINEKQKSTLKDSKMPFGLVPTVCPGRYLIDMKKYYPHFTAILEAALGSSRSGGLGYRRHDIGIFSNVLEDHLGSSKRLRSKKDIAQAKSFVFSLIKDPGYAVFNADDELVCSLLSIFEKKKKVQLVPVGYAFSFFNSEKHLQRGGSLITIDDNDIFLVSSTKRRKIINLNDISWSFNGQFKPSCYNLMLILGGLFAWNGGKITKQQLLSLTRYRLNKVGGRLVRLKNKKNVQIIIDFAHEKYSMGEVADLAKKICSNSTQGVLRLAPDRTDKMILETGKYLANRFNRIIIYDKIDGVNKKFYKSTGTTPSRRPGDVSKIFYDGIISKKKGGKIERIILEENAIKKASCDAKPGDVVVVISGDDHQKTLRYVKKYFKATFCENS